jgi:hypothetical protein
MSTVLLFSCHAQEEEEQQGEEDTQTETTGFDIPSTLQSLSTECPGEVARISPCISRDTDVTACTECVSLFIVENEDVLNAAGTGADSAEAGQRQQQPQQPNQDFQNETDTNTDTNTDTTDNDSNANGDSDAPNNEVDVCQAVESALCEGVNTCGSSCGLVSSESFLTFGSDCEALFGNLVACVLKSQNIATQCTLNDAACLGNVQVDGAVSYYFPTTTTTTTIFTTTTLVMMIITMVVGYY